MKKTDEVLHQADALIKRHRSFIATGTEGSDVPTLTDIVTPENLLNEIKSIVAAVLPESTDVQQVEALITTYFESSLGALQAQSAQLVENWLARELPRIVSHEMSSLVERITAEVLAEFRTNVLPKINALKAGAHKPAITEDKTIGEK